MGQHLRGMICGAVLAALCAAGTPAFASSTHYFYDPSGRFIGQTTQSTQIRSEVFDAEGNRQNYLMQIPHAATSSQALSANQSIFQAQVLAAGDGKHTLAFQEDGNVVLYDGSTAIWSTSTSSTAAATLIMQSDGNLVLYDAQNVALWASNTAGHAGSSLSVQTDGNLVIYSASSVALWSSGTSGK